MVIELPEPEEVDSSQLDYVLESPAEFVKPQITEAYLLFSVSKTGLKYLHTQLPSDGDFDSLWEPPAENINCFP